MVSDQDVQNPEEDFDFLNFLMESGVDVSKLKPEQIDALYEDFAGKRDLIATQRLQAESLMGTDMPDGRQAGGIYVASNPLESVGALANQYVGARANRRLDRRAEELNNKMAMNQKTYAQLIAEAAAGRASQGAETPPATPPAAATAPQAPVAPQGAGPAISPQQVSEQVLGLPSQRPAQQPMYGLRTPPAVPDSTPSWLAASLRGMDPLDPRNSARVAEQQRKIKEERERERNRVLPYNVSFRGF